ncbi:MAG: HNH endonuclease domain-containing protein [Halieaceae bacterium]|jgi:hypothetical protein|nr:HNH endonuclease domain-containing protein [Halieaceae bacterium]
MPVQAKHERSAWQRRIDGAHAGLAMVIGPNGKHDAQWLAGAGWEVVAIAPQREAGDGSVAGLRGVTRLVDQLPELRNTRAVGYRFDLIVLSRDWSDIMPDQRQRFLRILSGLLSAGGMLAIQTGSPAVQGAALSVRDQISPQIELETLARENALVLEPIEPRGVDGLPAAEFVILRLPDDGSGGLVTLRHIIINDSKSSTYKLALLRVLSRIAEAYPGAVIQRSDDWVTVPMGLVGLLWLKQYKTLILDHRLPQLNGNPGFAKTAFGALRDWADPDWNVGSSLSAESAAILVEALRDACQLIARMPAHYITYPGSETQIFEASYTAPGRIRGALRMERELFLRFGEIRLPAALWQSLGQYACWLQPAIVNEWVKLMRTYEPGLEIPDKTRMRMFTWGDESRFTAIARQRLAALGKAGQMVPCVWTNRKSRDMDIDHAFPWARWPNNDLWNLLPASSQTNRIKSDRLPTVAAFEDARPRIINWWEEAFVKGPFRDQFRTEVQFALPGLADDSSQSVERIFDAMLHQRARIKREQQLPDWSPN